MNYLLLGGAGFIGQHLAHRLLSIHAEVVVIDNLSTASYTSDDFGNYSGYHFIESDILDMDDDVLYDYIKNADVVYHLAGSVGVEHVDRYPRETLLNNVNLMMKLTPLFERAGTHVVFASTSEIYGEGPFKETDKASICTDKLRWGYASAKLISEFMLAAAGIPYNIVRLFNVVGPGQIGNYGMVLPKFIDAKKEGKPLTVFGDGNQVRAFCHIEDAVEMLLRIKQYPGETFNIGNDSNAITMIDLAKKISNQIDVVPYEKVFSKEHGDITNRVPDTSKVRQMTGYVPKYSIDDIIETML